MMRKSNTSTLGQAFAQQQRGYQRMKNPAAHGTTNYGPCRNYMIIDDDDPSTVTALLVGCVPTGMRPPRALPRRRLVALN